MVAQFIYAGELSPGGLDVAFLPAYGVTRDLLVANNTALTRGSPFSERDFEERSSVALLTPTLLRQARITGNPTGKKLEGFEIIGVVEEQLDRSLKDFVPGMLIPFPANPFTSLECLTVVVDDVAKVGQVRAELAAFVTDT